MKNLILISFLLLLVSWKWRKEKIKKVEERKEELNKVQATRHRKKEKQGGHQSATSAIAPITKLELSLSPLKGQAQGWWSEEPSGPPGPRL